jgi:hypothetical protein
MTTTRKLGKKPAKIDARTLKLSKYLTPTLPPPPQWVEWKDKVNVPWGVMLNDTLGDCTCAACGHLVIDWTANASTAVVLPDSDILSLYEGSCGYVPGDPSTDNGGFCLDVLNYWRTNGIGAGGHNIAAYASLDIFNTEQVRQAIALFGGIYVGIGLPLSAESEVGGLWRCSASTPGDAWSWGGHCIPVIGYETRNDIKGGIYTCVTWGGLQRMTHNFLQQYCDESYAILTTDWIEADRLAPPGFDLATLQADLALL